MNKIKNNDLQSIDGIIFNLGGVLVDEAVSYRKVIELTVNNFLKASLITQEDIQLIKSVPGYPNDWDTAYALITLIQNNIPKTQWTIEAAKLLPIDRKSPLFQEIYHYFQTCYLGSELYEKLEQGQAPFDYEPGMITFQKLLIDPTILKKLKQKGYKFSIVSECPKEEILITLENLKILGPDYFEAENIIAQEDVKKSRPDPEGLFKAKEKMNALSPIYVGDDMSDTEAARRAGMPCLFVGDQGENMINSVMEIFFN